MKKTLIIKGIISLLLLSILVIACEPDPAAGGTSNSIGTVDIVAGTGAEGDVNGAVAQAQFKYPVGIAVIGDIIYVSDANNNKIKKIANGQVSTLLGTGTAGSSNTASSETFNNPWGLHALDDGSLLVVGRTSGKARIITFATNGTATISNLLNGTYSLPADIIATSISNKTNATIYLVEQHKVKKITRTSAAIPAASPTIAGDSTGATGYVDAAGTTARFNNPTGIARIDDAHYLIADHHTHTIRLMTLDGSGNATITTVAGSNGVTGDTDGTGTVAKFDHPFSITAMKENNTGIAYITDRSNKKIRKLVIDMTNPTAANTQISTLKTINTELTDPTGITHTIQNGITTLYIAETNGHRISKITLK